MYEDYTVLTDAGDESSHATEPEAMEAAREYVAEFGGWAKVEGWYAPATSPKRDTLAMIR